MDISPSSPPSMGGVVEEEIKLTAPTKKIFTQIKLDPLLEKLAVGAWSEQPLLTNYIDTSDRYLLKSRLALRLRLLEPSCYLLGLKGFGSIVDGVAKRLEWEQRLTSPTNSFYSGLHYSNIGPGSVKDQIDGLVGCRDSDADLCFLPLMETDIYRQTRIFELDGVCRVEMALDHGTIRAGGNETSICEVEIEKVSGSLPPMHLFARELSKRYGLKMSECSKFSIGLSLSGIVLPSDF
jgi:triphosphatase